MSIQAFSFPVPETRFFQAGHQVFRFKIRRGEMSSIDKEDMLDGMLVTEELENAVRAVLANLDSLRPFTTQHFNIFPYKSKWEQVSKMRFMKKGVKLSPYPFVITLYVEDREPAFQCAVTNTNSWSSPESTSKRSQWASEPMRTVQTTAMGHPEEGTISQHKQRKLTTENSQCIQESPCSANGAEAMVCGSEIHADLDVHCLPASDFPQSPVPNSAAGPNTGIISRIASSLFPFSLFFHKSPAN
ncbi:membrane-anchored junction protein [Pimephales promelas]|uniref:membrane-anchored junction protein n=1 Tax=Pimephales promelas TaxID=90988 RepID=UPI001955600F|nr:membrane-anchored junction protein [Pimephales promelas]KAG1955464.1 membrane-anchored junction protein [Pimephales promelas]KAG1955465.1 membrane-anchored junction protein [Pimephales promelas]